MGMSVSIDTGTTADAEQILKLQYLCFQQEARLYDDYGMQPLTQSLDSVRGELVDGHAMVARLDTEVVAAVRGRVVEDQVAEIAKLIVHPRLQGHGLGSRLLRMMEDSFAERGFPVRLFRLRSGHRSEGNLRLYRRLGYTPVAEHPVHRRLRLVTCEKERPSAAGQQEAVPA